MHVVAVAALNVPAAQAVHVTVPVAEAYVAAAQFEQTVAPAALYVPTAQLTHVAAAAAAPYVPAAQTRQSSELS